MLKISRESEINLINVLIDNDIISGKDLPNIKKVSTEKNKSQIDAVFELKLCDEDKILDLLVKDQNLDVVELDNLEITDEVKTVLPATKTLAPRSNNLFELSSVTPPSISINASDSELIMRFLSWVTLS